MAVYLTSDWHLGHKKLLREFEDRPYETIEEMHQGLLKACKVLNNQDVLYFLGDLSIGMPKEDLLVFLKQIPCQIIFIRGNHDSRNTLNYILKNNYTLSTGVLKYKVEEAGAYLKKDGITYVLSHFPICIGSGYHRFRNIHGHIHSNKSPFISSINVGVDSPEIKNIVNTFGQPVLFDDVIQLLNEKIEKHFLEKES